MPCAIFWIRGCARNGRDRWRLLSRIYRQGVLACDWVCGTGRYLAWDWRWGCGLDAVFLGLSTCGWSTRACSGRSGGGAAGRVGRLAGCLDCAGGPALSSGGSGGADGAGDRLVPYQDAASPCGWPTVVPGGCRLSLQRSCRCGLWMSGFFVVLILVSWAYAAYRMEGVTGETDDRGRLGGRGWFLLLVPVFCWRVWVWWPIRW